MKALLALFTTGLLASATCAQVVQFKFDIETLGGRRITQEQFKKNVVLVDFWGTWCGPCIKAVPHLVELYKKYKHHGLEIIGLNYREGDDRDAALAKVRRFASQHGITYPLALGTEKIRKQVLGFGGYPTMLMFKRGMELDKIKVGFADGAEKELEDWIRAALELDGPSKKKGASKNPEAVAEAAEAKESKTAKVPEGKIYRPGNADTGFAYQFKKLDGSEMSFRSLRGKRVVLAITSTWDEEAKNTAKLLQRLHDTWSPKGVVVVAASMELSSAWSDRVEAVRAFISAQKVDYPVLPVGSSILKKIHRVGGVPLFLVFDAEGKLILRQSNEESIAAVEKAIAAKLKQDK